jgi:rubrerythrin
MSPSQLMIRTIQWVCPCCGEVARTTRQPQNCATCGRSGTSFEHREASVPSD